MNIAKKLKIKVYTDGSCKPNPGPGGWGVVMSHPTSLEETLDKPVMLKWEHYGYKKISTNNEMELTAIIKALELTPIGSDIHLTLDSHYVLQGIVKFDPKAPKEGTAMPLKSRRFGEHITILYEGWLKNWIDNNWKTSQNKPVLNVELWRCIVTLCEHHIKNESNLTFYWAKSHSTNIGNNLADKLANKGRLSLCDR